MAVTERRLPLRARRPGRGEPAAGHAHPAEEAVGGVVEPHRSRAGVAPTSGAGPRLCSEEIDMAGSIPAVSGSRVANPLVAVAMRARSSIRTPAAERQNQRKPV